MITRAILALGIVLAGVLQAEELTAQSKSTGEKGQGGAVYLHDSFDSYEIGAVPEIPLLQRVDKVTVVDGGGRVGSGRVARFDDSDASRGGSMEYNVGTSELGSMYVEFDALNNDPKKGDESSTEITKGNTVIGRAGFSSSSTKVADFLFDNLHMEDPSGEAKPTAPGAVVPSATEEVTLDRMPGAETMVYREGENSMNLFVYKPEDWKAGDKRSAFIYFFGGGWTKGTPLKSASTAAWAAKNGIVGIAPDYRTKNRFDTSPLASVDDARAAFGWVLEHADELGIDPTRVAVGGTSAGGHVALWTAIEKALPGSDPATSPKAKTRGVVPHIGRHRHFAGDRLHALAVRR